MLIDSICDNNVTEFKKEMVEYLKTHKVDDDFHFYSYSMPMLIFATELNKFDIVKSLIIDYNADVNIIYSGRTALYSACNYGYLHIIKLLCEHGSKIRVPDLDVSCKNGSIEIIHYLFEVNDSINIILYIMQKKPLPTLFDDKDIIKNCVNKIDSEGNTLFHYIYKFKNAIQLIPLLLKYGADINARNNLGQTPLFNICRYRYDLIDIMLEYKADTTIIDNDNKTILFEFIYNFTDQYDILDKLIPGINLNTWAHKNQLSILMCSAIILNIKLIKYFIRKGADLYACSPSG